MKRLDMKTPDFIEEHIKKLTELFPNCVTEAEDENGNLKKGIDFDLLRQELVAHIVEGPKERYRLDWPGKRAALLKANTPITKTLRPVREESVDFDTTKNLYIEGDNLEALKLLQEAYLGKIKMIYIDPPYNSGGDFIYKDNFARSREEELKESGQVDEEGNRLMPNLKSSGRFHSHWLSMMYSRLRLARNLLRDDGAIFISIDDNEVHNLRKICDEVFGEKNFVNMITIKMSELKGAKLSHVNKKFPKLKEYLLIYSKNKNSFKLNPIKTSKSKEDLKKYAKYYNKIIINRNKDVSEWKLKSSNASFEEKIENSDKFVYLVAPDQEKNFKLEPNTFKKIKNSNGKFDYYYNDNGKLKKILFLNENMTTYLGDLWLNISTININKENYEIPTYANGQKPIDLLLNIYKSFLNTDDIVLDFFGGSSTSADALLRFNGISRNNKFIIVQIPEKIQIRPGMSAETKKSIKKMIDFLKKENKPLLLTEIGKERIRRAGKKILEENADKKGIENLDIGFRVLKVDTSNVKDIYFTPDTIDQAQISKFVNHIKEDRTPEDLLFGVLVDWGVDLSLPIRTETIKDRTVYFVGHGDLAACFEENIDEKFVKTLAQKLADEDVLRVVFKENGFVDDNIKINTEQIFKQLAPATEVRVI